MAIKKNLFLNYFKPSIYLRSIKEINVNQLKRQGIKLFIADLDNTLVPHYTRLPSKEVFELIKKVKEAGMEFVIMSNNIRSRVEMFGKKAKVEWYASSKKPFKFAAKKIMNKYSHILPSEVIMIGDQIILDILVANRMKWESILVQPLVSTNYKFNGFNDFLENRVYKNLERKNILRRGEFIEGEVSNRFMLL